jgi:hypothetical protein
VLPFLVFPDPDTLGALAVERLFHGIAAPPSAPARSAAKRRTRRSAREPSRGAKRR